MNSDQIDEMTAAYVTCALWSSTQDGYWDEDASRFVSMESMPDNQAETWPLDEFFDADDISPEALATMRADCEGFFDANAEDLASIDATQAGHNLWLTRNSHGAGFWDRGLGALDDRLTDAAHAWGSSDLYVGDDNLLYVQ